MSIFDPVNCAEPGCEKMVVLYHVRGGGHRLGLLWRMGALRDMILPFVGVALTALASSYVMLAAWFRNGLEEDYERDITFR